MGDVAISRFLRPTATEWGHSKWETLEKCPKLFELRYRRGIRRTESPRAASLGTVVHRGLAAAYWRRMNPQRESDLPHDFWRTVINAGREDEAIKLDAIRLVSEHQRFWADHDEGFDRVVAVEKLVTTEVNGVPYSTRYDLVAKKRHLPIIEDHKTTSRRMDNTGSEFAMSGQFMGMLAVWPYVGPRPSSVRVDFLVKTQTPAFHRIGVPFTERQIERWKKDLRALYSDLKRYERSGRFPRRYSACVGRYGFCEMFSICHGGTGLADEYYVPKGTNMSEALK